MSGLLRVALHGGEMHEPGAWTWEPSVVLGVALLVALYLYAVGPLRRQYGFASPIEPWRVALFLLANLVLLLTLVSPLEVLSDEYLFSAHMVQHLLLAMVVAPLWLLGTPGWLLRVLINSPGVWRLGRRLTHPVAAFAIFNLNFWLWHWPPLYDWAVANEPVHIFQHLTFMVTGVINWWPLLSPLREVPRPSYPVQLLYLAVNCQPNVILGAIFVFARDILYGAYVGAPRLFGLSVLADQQLGGLIMWIPGNAVYLAALSVVFFRWFYRQEKGLPDWEA